MKKDNLLRFPIPILIILFLLTGIFAVFASLVITKKVKLNPYFSRSYTIRGVDVSNYQGEIDWEVLASQDIDFAFIKATEGSSHQDPSFEANWKKASETDLAIGAYHFFSFDSPGSTQAQWYMETVGDLSGKLVPVIDVEYYGNKAANPPSTEEVAKQLQDCLTLLEEEYGKKPIIYTTYKVYRRYIKDNFSDYPLWIRNVYYSPDLDMKGKWQFWQYSDTAILEGYVGKEPCIDLNVFYGSREEFENYLIHTNE
ncbi:MAG: glycoside hydrolase family 25 [Lachnospiraceae bacterium]|nr:glycoside hydrolase family 25 [Lachnospiraceae bacterium]